MNAAVSATMDVVRRLGLSSPKSRSPDQLGGHAAGEGEPTQDPASPLDREFGPLQRLEVAPNRVLTFRVFGTPLKSGPEKVVLYHHGTPSCHLEAAAFDEAAVQQGISVIAFDRPGVGGSTYHRQLSLASFAIDCATALDELGAGRVIILGNSGGGPYAVAFAVLHPARVEALGLVAALAPTDWGRREHRANLASMAGFDKFQLHAARNGPTRLLGTPTLWLAHRAMRYMAEKKPRLLLEQAPKGMAAVDGELMRTDPRVRDNFATVLQHAYSGSGARGVGRDVKVLGRCWGGVRASDVSCRTLIFHGAEDKSVPLTHSHYYASKIKDHDLVVVEGEGHVTLPVRQARLILASLLKAAEGGRGLAPSPSAHVLSGPEERALADRVSLDLERQAQETIEREGPEPSEESSQSAGEAFAAEGETEGNYENEARGFAPALPLAVPVPQAGAVAPAQPAAPAASAGAASGRPPVTVEPSPSPVGVATGGAARSL